MNSFPLYEALVGSRNLAFSSLLLTELTKVDKPAPNRADFAIV